MRFIEKCGDVIGCEKSSEERKSIMRCDYTSQYFQYRFNKDLHNWILSSNHRPHYSVNLKLLSALYSLCCLLIKRTAQSNKQMFNKNKEELKELKEEIAKVRLEQMEFLIKANEIMKSVLDSSKSKFMYELREEEINLVEDGKKYRAIRKIID